MCFPVGQTRLPVQTCATPPPPPPPPLPCCSTKLKKDTVSHCATREEERTSPSANSPPFRLFPMQLALGQKRRQGSLASPPSPESSVVTAAETRMKLPHESDGASAASPQGYAAGSCEHRSGPRRRCVRSWRDCLRHSCRMLGTYARRTSVASPQSSLRLACSCWRLGPAALALIDTEVNNVLPAGAQAATTRCVRVAEGNLLGIPGTVGAAHVDVVLQRPVCHLLARHVVLDGASELGIAPAALFRRPSVQSLPNCTAGAGRGQSRPASSTTCASRCSRCPYRLAHQHDNRVSVQQKLPSGDDTT